MNKYDEIMEKITLSPEARDRIIDNITEEISEVNEVPNLQRTHVRKTPWKRYLAVAACCVLVFAGVRTALDSGLFRMGSSGSSSDMIPEQNLSVEQNEGTSGAEPSDAYDESEAAVDEEKSSEAIWDVKGLGSEEELSDDLGFSMKCEGFLDKTEAESADSQTFTAYGNGMGEVTVTRGESKNYFRKAIGTDDISGDYNTYEYSAEFEKEGYSGTLKGDSEDGYRLAIWTSSDGYTYAAFIEEGLSEDEWYALVESCTIH